MTRRELLGAAGAASLLPLLPPMNQTDRTANVVAAPPRAVLAARQAAGPRPSDPRREAGRARAGRLRARDVGSRSERDRERACVSGPSAGAEWPRARRSSSIIHTAAATRSARPSSSPGGIPPADAIREGADGSRLRGAVHRPLGLRRAQPHVRAGYVQGDAVARAGAVGNDGLRQPARRRLSLDARRRRQPAHRHAGHVDGQHHGVVAGRARRAHQGDRRHQLPDRLPGAARRQGIGPARRLLLRAGPPQSFHHGADQYPDRAARAPRASPAPATS